MRGAKKLIPRGIGILLVALALRATGAVGCGGDGEGGSAREGTTDDPEACREAIAKELDRAVDEGRLLLPYRDGNTDAATEIGVEEINNVCRDPQRLADGIDTDEAANEVLANLKERYSNP